MSYFTKANLRMKLTPNFSLSEFAMPDAISELTPEILLQIQFVAQRLQVVRDLLSKPIEITSGWRTLEHNKSVGGARYSYHVKGMAADLIVVGMSPKKVQAFLKHWSGGMGCYSTFTHLDTRSKKTRW